MHLLIRSKVTLHGRSGLTKKSTTVNQMTWLVRVEMDVLQRNGGSIIEVFVGLSVGRGVGRGTLDGY